MRRHALQQSFQEMFSTVPDGILSIEYLAGVLGPDQNPFRLDTIEWVHYREHFAPSKVPDFPELSPNIRPSKRRLPQPPFKPVFDSLSDIRRRLLGSCIFVGADPFQVSDISSRHNDFLLLLADKTGKRYRCYYSCEAVDLRSIEPQYVNTRQGLAFVYRSQGRSQQQGMNSENMFGYQPQNKDTIRIHDILDVLAGPAEPCSWAAQYANLMRVDGVLPALRLSKHVAFTAKSGNIVAHYKDREIGEVNDDVVRLSESDHSKPWIRRAVQEVGCLPQVRSK